MASSALREQHATGSALNPVSSTDNCERPFFRPPSSSGSVKYASRFRLYASLLLADVASLCVAFLLANLFRFGLIIPTSGLAIATILIPTYLAIALNNHAYSIDVLMSPKLGVQRAARSLFISVAIVIGAFFCLKASAEFSRVVLAVGSLSAVAFLCFARWWLGNLIGGMHEWRFTNEILFTDGVHVVPTKGQFVHFADRAQLTPAANDPALRDRIGRLLKNCDRVVLACLPERRAEWAALMKGYDVNIEMLVPELDQIGALALGHLGDRATVVVSHSSLGFRDRMLKRTFDLAITIPAILMLLPAFVLIATAVKLDSDGPVLFAQPRTGLGNRTFHMLKFRSMSNRAPDEKASKLTEPNDIRVTRVGRFLRRTSLDELPQLFNVLAGDMSIVGPRPHAAGALAGDALYWDVDDRYWDRHAVKPGMTGLAQVRGFRGTTFQQSDLSDRLQADLEYLAGWSIWKDVAIAAATFKVLTHRNAF